MNFLEIFYKTNNSARTNWWLLYEILIQFKKYIFIIHHSYNLNNRFSFNRSAIHDSLETVSV